MPSVVLEVLLQRWQMTPACGECESRPPSASFPALSQRCAIPTVVNPKAHFVQEAPLSFTDTFWVFFFWVRVSLHNSLCRQGWSWTQEIHPPLSPSAGIKGVLPCPASLLTHEGEEGKSQGTHHIIQANTLLKELGSGMPTEKCSQRRGLTLRKEDHA